MYEDVGWMSTKLFTCINDIAYYTGTVNQTLYLYNQTVTVMEYDGYSIVGFQSSNPLCR